MTRDKQVRNRKGRKGGCRNRRHAQTLARMQFRQEFFMSHRDMRGYWEEAHAPLYGPLALMTRWLQLKSGTAGGKPASDHETC